MVDPESAARVTRVRTRDPAAAERLVWQFGVPARLDVSAAAGELDLTLVWLHLGAIALAKLSFGRELRVLVDHTDDVQVTIPLAGVASVRIGGSDPVRTAPGQAAVWGRAESADVHWTADCVQLWLTVQHAKLQSELERLIGRSVGSPVRFESLMDLRSGMLAGWRDAVEVLTHEFDSTPGLASHPRTSRHLERLLVHGLLLCQPHNYSAALDGTAGFGTRQAVTKAVELLEEHSEEPWTTSRLAREVHVSVRSLQEGFRRQTGSPPMTYLRDVRLSRVRSRLQRAEPGKTTVQAEASRCGFVHLGRFAAAYRAAFGETPSSTLARPTRSD